MNIVHIAANSPYNDYWGYQDNILPKYQRKMGHEVTVITTNKMHQDGKIVETECSDYILNDGVRVIRLKYKKILGNTLTNIMSHMDIYGLLCEIQPEFIFYHGLVSNTIFDVIRYKKKHNCVVVQDNHLDYNIGYSNSLKHKLLKLYFKFVNSISIKHVEKVYGVTPWRKQYAEEIFGIPSNKTDVLIMGADDEKIDFQNRDQIRHEIRQKYHLEDDDFVVVTGGKIDKKKNIVLLMEAVAQLGNVHLLIFGNVLSDVNAEFDRILRENENIHYAGWIDADKVYDYFFAADLVVFPGQHSVLWEQACAAKVPCVFQKWEGMEHVNNGGNAAFLTEVTVLALKTMIQELNATEKYFEMKAIAESSNTDIFLYSEIAKKSLEMI